MKKLIMTAALVLGTAPFAVAQQDTATPTAQTVNETDTTTTTSSTDTRDEDRISKGGLFLEPMIFGSQEDMSIKTSQLSGLLGDTSGTARSYGAGLRFGGHISEIFLLGVDGRYAKSTMDDSSYGNVDGNVYNVAPMIGLQTPIAGIRLTGAYVVAGENDPDAGNGFDVKFKEATGWRVGAGLHVLAVSVNLEYQDLTYNSTDVEAVGPLASSIDADLDARSQGYTLSVGFPIEL